MMRTVVLVLALLAGQAVVPDDAADELEQAKALYRDGRFGVAVARLQTAILKLASEPDMEAASLREEAYLYLGLTYVALDDPEAAKNAFKEVARLSPERRLDRQIYAPKVIELFEQARRDVSREGPPPPQTADEPAPAAGESAPTEPPSAEGSSAVLWGLLGAAAGGGGVAAVTSLGSSETTTTSSTTTTSTTTTIPTPTVRVDFRVNGVERGTFSCSQPMLFSIDVINDTSQTINVQGFNLSMISLAPECTTHQPAINGTTNVDILPDARIQIRQLDLASDLCRQPGRAPGCEWRGVVTVLTSDGMFQDDVQFTTTP